MASIVESVESRHKCERAFLSLEMGRRLNDLDGDRTRD